MGLFDNDNDNGNNQGTMNSGQAPNGFLAAAATTPATGDASSDDGRVNDFFSNLNPVQHLMAVKTGLVTSKTNSTETTQTDGNNGATVSEPALSGSEPSKGNSPYTEQPVGGAATANGGGSENNSQNQGGNSQKPSPYSRKLTDLEKYYFRGAGYNDDLLDNLTIHSGKPHLLLLGGKDAVTTSANEIYMRHGVDKPDSINDLKFLAHELGHAQQYLEGMTWKKYFDAWNEHGYENSPYEKDAEKRAEEAFEKIKALKIQEIRREAGANPDGTYAR
ncbi:MAG: DUF4157 domain-containing protein [Acidobacteriota bacterium]